MAFDNFFRAKRFLDDTITGSDGRDLIIGFFGDDRLFGGGGNDMIRAGFGNDYIEGGAGSDFIDGGFGIDTAGYLGNFADYQISVGPFTRITNAAGETDTLRNVEVLQFADRTIYLDGRDNGPVAEDDAAAVDAGQTLTLDAAMLLANDSDFDGDTLTVTGVGAAAQGTVEFIGGQVRYTPGAAFATLPAGQTATDSFTYTVESNGVSTTATVTVTVTGTYVPDPVAALISEIRPNPTGTDPATQTVELSGKAGETFTGWLLSVEGDNASGTIDRAAQITGTFDENGLLTAEIQDLENPGFTLILTDRFTGSIGDSILPNGGTTPDTSALGTIFDAVGVPDQTGDTTFGAALGGVDMVLTSEPQLLFRDGSTGAFYAVDQGKITDAAGNEIPAAEFSSDPTAASFGGLNPTRGAAPVAALISEIRPNPPGSDPATQTVELSGTPGASFDGWLLSVEGDGSQSGVIDRAARITGTFDENGLLTAEIPDLENPSFTLILTDSFTGSVGDSIDPGKTGAPTDTSALGTVLDAVGVLDGAGDTSYAGAFGGTDMAPGPEPVLLFRAGSTGAFHAVLFNGKVLDAAGDEVDPDSFDADPRGETFGGVNPDLDDAPLPLTLVINEILADPASGSAGDANGDGTRNASQDEFVEIVNTGTSAIDLSGLTLSDGLQLRHVFAEGTTLAPQQAIVVFGGGTPTGSFGGAQVVTASTGALGLNNGGDTVTLAKDGNIVDQVIYGREGGGNTSLTRIPDLTGEFDKHTQAGGRFSPGTKVDGDRFDDTSGPETTLISAVQGSGESSTMVGETVTIEAIVVGDFQGNRKPVDAGGKDDGDTKRSLNGFFVQEEAADHDGDAKTSEGLFIYDPSLLTDVALGDKVRITGRVGEFNGMTQLTAASVEITQAGAVADVNTMATKVEIDPIDAVQESRGTYSVDLEAVEGMIATFPETLTVIESYNLDRFNEIRLSASERPQQFTQGNEPDAAAYGEHLKKVFSDVVTFDDGLSVKNAPVFNEADINGDGKFTTADGFGMGDTITDLTGVVHYSFNTFRIRSVDDSNRFEDTQTRDATPPITSTDGDGKLSITSFNVLNFFTTLDQNGNTAGPGGLEPRGAHNTAEYERQLDKLLTTLTTIDSDLYGLVELENDFSKTGDTAIKALVDGLNARYGETVWDWVYPGRDYVDTGDAISVGIIYKTSQISYTEGSAAVLDDAAVAAMGLTPDYALFDGKSTNRAPLLANFTEKATGEAFSVAVTHMKSKGSVNPNGNNADAGDGAGNNDEIRTLGVEALTKWLDPATGLAQDRQIVLGDFNAYAKENPIDAMKAKGYVNLEETLGGDADTFVFNGQTGTLDYAFANAQMERHVTQAAAWEINSNEPDVIDYNTDDGRDADIFDGSVPYRSSDHDPLTVEIMLGDAIV